MWAATLLQATAPLFPWTEEPVLSLRRRKTLVPAEWNLSGKSAIVTGHKRGWTDSLASALAEAGADVLVAAHSQQAVNAAAAAVRKHGRKAAGIVADVSRLDDVKGMVRKALQEFGKIDILVNNAQVELGKPAVDTTNGEWDRVMAVNVKGMFLCCREVGKEMLKAQKGRIVNISSGLAVRGLWNSSAYCASQGAVLQLTKALALEWARSDIRVNGVGAGWLSTARVPQEEALKDPLVRYIPLRRLGHPDDLAGLVVYLASDACTFVTGHTVFVDGGALAHA